MEGRAQAEPGYSSHVKSQATAVRGRQVHTPHAAQAKATILITYFISSSPC